VETEIATPFGLAMTICGVKKFNAFVLVTTRKGKEEEIVVFTDD
jgi:hypothetical protein